MSRGVRDDIETLRAREKGREKLADRSSNDEDEREADQ